eukprot:g4629.t1
MYENVREDSVERCADVPERDVIEEEEVTRDQVEADRDGKGSAGFAYGVGLLCIVVAIWTGSTYLVKFIYDNDFKAPFFLTYVCNSLFVVYLPVFWLRQRSKSNSSSRRSKSGAASVSHATDLVYTAAPSNDSDDNVVALTEDEDHGSMENDRLEKNSFTSPRRAIRGSEVSKEMNAICLKAALIVAPIWFCANGSYNLSLSATSPSSNTIISSLSGLFTYAISIIFMSEIFDGVRFLGVVLSIAGAIFVAIADNTQRRTDEKIWGDLVCLLSAFLYGTYTVAIRRYLPEEESKTPMMLFFGYLGAFNAFVFGVVGIFLWVFHVEDLSGLTWKTLGMVLAKAFFDNVLSDLLWAKAVLLTSPTIATIGLTMTVPCSIFIDTMTNGFDTSSFLHIFGGASIILGFICVAKPQVGRDRLEHSSGATNPRRRQRRRSNNGSSTPSSRSSPFGHAP